MKILGNWNLELFRCEFTFFTFFILLPDKNLKKIVRERKKEIS